MQCDDGSITRDERKIRNEQYKFYKKLYSKDPNVMFHFINTHEVSHSEEACNSLEQDFTYEEFTKALKLMAKGKAPGNDGLTTVFYIIMWSKLGRILWNAVLESHHRGILYKSGRKGVISLIPKKDKNALLIKSWRPICLLNTDLKIITKMLTIRLKPFLKEVIGKQQTGYVPGRYIGVNLRKLIDLIQYLESEEASMILMNVDFEKCLDSIDHDALMASLKYFGIGDHFLSWVKMMYNGFELCVINNGKWTSYFTQERGVHQGSALSGPVFLYVAEILALNIKANPKIIGIKIDDNEEKLLQYADDTNIWSTHSEDSINAIIDELETFRKNTGLKANYEKTVLHRVGKTNAKRLYLKKKFKWGGNTIDTLGVILSCEGDVNLMKDNYDTVLQKASNVMSSWTARGLSLAGKIEVVNTLVNSLFVYKMQILSAIDKETEARIAMLISTFIWNARKPKIRTNILCMKQVDGGRNLSSLVTRDMSLKIEWICRLHFEMDPASVTVAFYLINCKLTNELLWDCNFSVADVDQFECKSEFWKSTVKAWAKYNYCCSNQMCEEQKANQILWYNSEIKINNKMVFFRKWYERGIIYVKDLVFERRIASKNELQTCYELTIDQMDYNALLSAIPNDWKKFIISMYETEWQSKYGYLCNYKKWSRIVYYNEIRKSDCINETSIKLARNCKLITQREQVEVAFRSIDKYAEIPKYRAFQFRLLHNAILLNNRLIHMGISRDDLCFQCKKAKETVLHLFWECEVTQRIVLKVIEFIKQNDMYNLNIKLDAVNFILSTVDENEYSCVNLISVIIKQKIYAAKCTGKKINAQVVINEILFIQEIERDNGIFTGNIKKYNARWPQKIEKNIRRMDNIIDEIT